MVLKLYWIFFVSHSSIKFIVFSSSLCTFTNSLALSDACREFHSIRAWSLSVCIVLSLQKLAIKITHYGHQRSRLAEVSIVLRSLTADLSEREQLLRALTPMIAEDLPADLSGTCYEVFKEIHFFSASSRAVFPQGYFLYYQVFLLRTVQRYLDPIIL